MAAGVKRSFVSGRRTAKSASDVAANATTRPESSLNGLHNQVCRVHRALTARRRAFRNARGKEPARRRTNAHADSLNAHRQAVCRLRYRKPAIFAGLRYIAIFKFGAAFGNPSFHVARLLEMHTNIKLLANLRRKRHIKRKRIISFLLLRLGQ